MPRRPLPAATVYLVMEATSGVAFTMMATIAAVYRIRNAGLDPLQLVLLGTALEATVLLFEVPTGVVADTVSRRRSVIVGMLLVGAGFVLEGAIPSFGTILLAQVVWGLGWTFTSGADVAWLADEVGEARAARLYLRGAQASQLGSFAGIVVSVVLATVGLWLPIVAAGLVYLGVAGFLLVAMPEDWFPRHPRASARARLPRLLGSTARGGVAAVRARPVLLLIFAVAAFHGASTEGFDRLWVLELLDDIGLPGLAGLDPVLWFGVVNAVGLLLAAVATEVVRRTVDVASHRGAAGVLAVVNLLLVLGVAGFGLAGSFWAALALLWVVGLLRALNDPLTAAWVNQGLDPASRATVNSLAGQADALGQVVGGPLLGWVALARSVRAAIVVSGLLRLPALLLFARTLRPDASRPDPGAAPARPER